MLRHFQKVVVGLAAAPSFKSYKTLADYSVQEVDVPSNLPLPDASTTDIRRLIEAKIPLETVNTKIGQRVDRVLAEINDAEFLDERAAAEHAVSSPDSTTTTTKE
jgi:hypothetical protein